MSIKEGYQSVVVKLKRPGTNTPYIFRLRPDYACCEDPSYNFIRKHSQGHIEGSLKIEVQGGCGPYTWESSEELLYFLDEDGFHVQTVETAGTSVFIYEEKREDPTIPFSGGQVTVTDSCGEFVTIDIVSCAQNKILEEDAEVEIGCLDTEWEGHIRLFKTLPFDNYIVASKITEVVDDVTLSVENLKMALGDSFSEFASWDTFTDPSYTPIVNSDTVLKVWYLVGSGEYEEDPELISLDVVEFTSGDIVTSGGSIKYDPDTIKLSAEHGIDPLGPPTEHCQQRAENVYSWIIVEFDVFKCDCQKSAIYWVNGGNMPFAFVSINGQGVMDDRYEGDTRVIGFTNYDYNLDRNIWTGIGYTVTCSKGGVTYGIDGCGYTSTFLQIDPNPISEEGLGATISEPGIVSCGGDTYTVGIAGISNEYCSPTYNFDHSGTGVFEEVIETRTCEDGWKGTLEQDSTISGRLTTPAGDCCVGEDLISLFACEGSELLDQFETSEYTGTTDLAWAVGNPDTIGGDNTVIVDVEGGTPPFTWVITTDQGDGNPPEGNYSGASLSNGVTYGRSNAVITSSGCGGFDIVVTDACGSCRGSFTVTVNTFLPSGAFTYSKRSPDYPRGTGGVPCQQRDTIGVTVQEEEDVGRYRFGMISGAPFNRAWYRCCPESLEPGCMGPPIVCDELIYPGAQWGSSPPPEPYQLYWIVHSPATMRENELRTYPTSSTSSPNPCFPLPHRDIHQATNLGYRVRRCV